MPRRSLPTPLPAPSLCRNRRRILGLTAAGAAGSAAAYTLYKWWYAESAETSEAGPSSSGSHPQEGSVLLDPRGSAGAAQLVNQPCKTQCHCYSFVLSDIQPART